jgi:hypothetical protein
MSRTTRRGQPRPADAQTDARAQQLAVEQALEELAEMTAGGLTDVEAALAEGLRQAARRLVEIADQVANDGLTVAGSMGQLRQHPMLSEERALRREIAVRLPQLAFRVDNRRVVEMFKPTSSYPDPDD